MKHFRLTVIMPVLIAGAALVSLPCFLKGNGESISQTIGAPKDTLEVVKACDHYGPKIYHVVYIEGRTNLTFLDSCNQGWYILADSLGNLSILKDNK